MAATGPPGQSSCGSPTPVDAADPWPGRRGYRATTRRGDCCGAGWRRRATSPSRSSSPPPAREDTRRGGLAGHVGPRRRHHLVRRHADDHGRASSRQVLDRAAAVDGLPLLVVVDDAHLLSAACVRLVDERLTSDPHGLRLVLLTRWDLSISRLVPELLGHLTILRGDVLRLTREESIVAGHPARRRHPAEDPRSRRRPRRAAGALPWSWPLEPAPLCPPARTRPQFVKPSGQTIADLVAGEVFVGLRPQERHLLLCVAGEPDLTTELARHLTRDPRAGEALDSLETTGLLVNRVSADLHAADTEERYRIHPAAARGGAPPHGRRRRRRPAGPRDHPSRHPARSGPRPDLRRPAPLPRPGSTTKPAPCWPSTAPRLSGTRRALRGRLPPAGRRRPRGAPRDLGRRRLVPVDRRRRRGRPALGRPAAPPRGDAPGHGVGAPAPQSPLHRSRSGARPPGGRRSDAALHELDRAGDAAVPRPLPRPRAPARARRRRELAGPAPRR